MSEPNIPIIHPTVEIFQSAFHTESTFLCPVLSDKQEIHMRLQLHIPPIHSSTD